MVQNERTDFEFCGPVADVERVKFCPSRAIIAERAVEPIASPLDAKEARLGDIVFDGAEVDALELSGAVRVYPIQHLIVWLVLLGL